MKKVSFTIAIIILGVLVVGTGLVISHIGISSISDYPEFLIVILLVIVGVFIIIDLMPPISMNRMRKINGVSSD